MFSASRAYFDGMRRRSDEIRFEDEVKKSQRFETVKTAGGDIAVRREVSFGSSTHMYFQPPLADGTTHVRLGYGFDDSWRDRDTIRQAENYAEQHDAVIAAMQEQPLVVPAEG